MNQGFGAKATALFFAFLTLATSVSAGATDYYNGKGRIALSSDGNKHDNDDQLATKMTLMILAKAGLQNQTVLYTYADHVWGSEGNDLDLMKLAAEKTGELFGFTSCNFIAAVEQPEAAYDAMAAEIAKSTESDPLFIIAAGPMQVVGEGFARAEKINAEALNHVTIISHSIWNEVHSDNYEKANSVHGGEPEHSGWTWKEMEAAFGDKVNFNHISDQNATGTGQAVYKNKDKFSAPNWDKWAWMKDHQDPNIQWVRNNEGISCGPDYSDAGIAYYMVADLDGVRGDEFGNPEKLQRWIGADPIPTNIDPTKVARVNVDQQIVFLSNKGDKGALEVTVSPATAVKKDVVWSTSDKRVAKVGKDGVITASGAGNAVITATTVDGGKVAQCAVRVGAVEAGETTVGEDFIAIEAESAIGSLTDGWALRVAGDDKYDQVAGVVPAVNGTYIEYMVGVNDGLGIKSGIDVLTYKFTPKSDGVYRLTGRMAQQLNQDGAVAKWDQCNDIYVKLEGDYTADATPMNVLSNWNKFYGRGFNSWGCFVQVDINHAKYKPVYNLKAGVEYTLYISGRSRGVCIDYFLFTKSPIVAEEKVDIGFTEPSLRPDAK